MARLLEIKDIPTDKARQEAEGKLRSKIAEILKPKLGWAEKQIAESKPIDLDALKNELQGTLQTELLEILKTELSLESAAFDPAVYNVAAEEWAKQYTYALVKDITDVTRDIVSNAEQQFIQGNVNRGGLQALLQPAFGAERADKIAVTETTRAYAQAQSINKQILSDAGIETERVWRTNKDDLVCEICIGLNGVAENEQGLFVHQITGMAYDIPAHIGDRCGVSLRNKKT